MPMNESVEMDNPLGLARTHGPRAIQPREINGWTLRCGKITLHELRRSLTSKRCHRQDTEDR